MPHFVVSISGHGYGHVAQTAPILNHLHDRMPALRITVRSSVSLDHLRARIRAPFELLSSVGDIGMVMSSALDVDVEQSRAAYRDFHAGWDSRVAEEANLLRELGADLVFSNVGYLPLAGAQSAGIPNVSLCSLNWADIYRHYCGEDSVSAQIQSCYANADAFFRATPGMAMSDLPNLVLVSPIAEIGINRRDELNRHLNVSDDVKLVLVSMGGITSRLPVEDWPRIDGVRWLVQDNWQIEHPDAIVLESLTLGFSDLLASCDALLCKPGYGSFVEAACSNVPVLFVSRADWPESPALVEWLKKHGRCLEIARQALEQGGVETALNEIWQMPQVAQVVSAGAEQVAHWLMNKLENTGNN
ncbi:MAG: hypothetical protein R8M11_08555 [Gallionella sp.]